MKIWGQRFPISGHLRSHKGQKKAHDDLQRSESPPETTRDGRRERRGVAAEAVWRPCNSF